MSAQRAYRSTEGSRQGRSPLEEARTRGSRGVVARLPEPAPLAHPGALRAFLTAFGLPEERLDPAMDLRLDETYPRSLVVRFGPS